MQESSYLSAECQSIDESFRLQMRRGWMQLLYAILPATREERLAMRASLLSMVAAIEQRDELINHHRDENESKIISN